jgi:glycerol kinase
MTASDATMQFLADILGAPVDRPEVMETTAWARLSCGTAGRACARTSRASPKPGTRAPLRAAMDAATRERKWAGWRDAVARTLTRQD